MKVFVYSKKTSKKIAELTSIITVAHYHLGKDIIFMSEGGEQFKFNTDEVKTTTYQN